MRAMRMLVGLAAVVLVAAAAMYLASFWTGEALGGPVFSARLALILILLGSTAVLLPKLGRGTLPRKLWSWITAAVGINVIPVVMETVNAFAGRKVFSPDLIFVFFILVFIPVLVVIGSLYFGFKRQGFDFARAAMTTVLPSLVVFACVTLFVLIVPMASSDIPMGVRVSDIFALVVQVAALCVVAFMAITIGKGEAGRPFLFISLALVCIMVQTVLTAHIRLVGMMSATEPADFFLHLAYYLLILAARFQYMMSIEPA
ncbi:MAG: hypothetical protein HPY75_10975 [Actinobacteria bacterium]|nr:hypothetical protein [Actinomycetota bacterium]